ncbi:3894_t:CDS:1 [Diversispora eburnea]|uniref:3894_t:CDS:1 n=1 Tax=Diversispora eburnea TaxID=1213867 RepID=A0A9N9DJX3_9GLOM|nr:3894_t:CDS:1 [Diversispora eburnea]
MSDSSTSVYTRRSARIQLASQSNMQTQLKSQRNNSIKKVDKTTASFTSKDSLNTKSNTKDNSDIKEMEVTVMIEQPEVIMNSGNGKGKEKQSDIDESTTDIEKNNGNVWTEVTNKKKKAKYTNNTALNSNIIEDKESVASYETDNSFHSD